MAAVSSRRRTLALGQGFGRISLPHEGWRPMLCCRFQRLHICALDAASFAEGGELGRLAEDPTRASDSVSNVGVALAPAPLWGPGVELPGPPAPSAGGYGGLKCLLWLLAPPLDSPPGGGLGASCRGSPMLPMDSPPRGGPRASPWLADAALGSAGLADPRPNSSAAVIAVTGWRRVGS